MPYDLDHQAMACANELFYRNGPTPEDIRTRDAAYVVETIRRFLMEAQQDGISSALSSEDER